MRVGLIAGLDAGAGQAGRGSVSVSREAGFGLFVKRQVSTTVELHICNYAYVTIPFTWLPGVFCVGPCRTAHNAEEWIPVCPPAAAYQSSGTASVPVHPRASVLTGRFLASGPLSSANPRPSSLPSHESGLGASLAIARGGLVVNGVLACLAGWWPERPNRGVGGFVYSAA